MVVLWDVGGSGGPSPLGVNSPSHTAVPQESDKTNTLSWEAHSVCQTSTPIAAASKANQMTTPTSSFVRVTQPTDQSALSAGGDMRTAKSNTSRTTPSNACRSASMSSAATGGLL